MPYKKYYKPSCPTKKFALKSIFFSKYVLLIIYDMNGEEYYYKLSVSLTAVISFATVFLIVVVIIYSTKIFFHLC